MSLLNRILEHTSTRAGGSALRDMEYTYPQVEPYHCQRYTVRNILACYTEEFWLTLCAEML